MLALQVIIVAQLSGAEATDYGSPERLIRLALERIEVGWEGSRPVILSSSHHCRCFHTHHLFLSSASAAIVYRPIIVVGNIIKFIVVVIVVE